jgi:hypothetical protein
MGRRNLLAWVAAAVAAVTLSCGGGGPSSPSGTGVEVKGVVLSGASAVVASSGSHPATAKAQKVTVTVEGTTITAEVGADGTFVLKGVPSGDFTLVFTVDGVKIGEVPVSAPDDSEVKITVKVEASQVVLVDIKIEARDGSEVASTCVINGGRKGQGVELEGTVSSGNAALFNMTVNGGRAGALASVNAAGATYKCVGGSKKDTADECKALVAKGGAKVHVRGTLAECTTTVAEVTASEVKIQKE